MNYKFEEVVISKDELSKLDEDDVCFITIPGRMGDEDGVTIIVKNDNKYLCYRAEGLMYPKDNKEYEVSFNDLYNVFPLWKDVVESGKLITEKYKSIYMGFGNILCVDSGIYDEFIPYLLDEVKKNDYYKESIDEYGEYSPSLNYSSWKSAFENMVNDK